MRLIDFTYAKSININGVLVPKMRGQRIERIIPDKTKYNRCKMKRRYEEC
jgi:hypothetical protein